MNRIILIGNGFDLAHGLKTSYKDFIDDYLFKIRENIIERKVEKTDGWKNFSYDGYFYEDENISFEQPLYEFPHKYIANWDIVTSASFKNKFLEHIIKKSLNNWVDIENEYYEQLKICTKSDDIERIEKLNSEFSQIKNQLENYLSQVETNKISKMKDIYNLCFDYFRLQDFPNNKLHLLIEYLCKFFSHGHEEMSNEYYMYYFKSIDKLFKESKGYFSNYEHSIDLIKVEDIIKYFNIYKKEFHDDGRKLEDTFKIYPFKTMFLNFNYTKTDSLYSKRIIERWNPNKFPFFWISSLHIHGELNNKNNSIIFGYGDELADEYKEIEKLNNNEYLKNVKSMSYLKTDNYKRLLDFVNSDYYQILILGHSCGNSDRTLLNTLFEHKNCISIKPFYYKKDETDNYEEILMNISRNFIDKRAFREMVVNKMYCEPLPQFK